VKRAIQTCVLLLAVASFGWFIAEAGAREILEAFSEIGAGSLLMPFPYLVVYYFDTLGWVFAFPRQALANLPFWLVVKLRLAGEAVNNVVPAAMLGGEPVKAYLAIKHGVDRISAMQSVVVAKTTMTLAQLLMLLLAASLISGGLPVDSPAHRAMAIVMLVAGAIVAMLFWMQRRGMFGGMLSLLRRAGIRIAPLERREQHLLDLDRTISAFYRHDRMRFFASTAFHLAGWIAGLLEVLLVAYLVGIPVSWQEALAVEAFASVAKAIGAFAPGSIGVQESGIVVVFRLFGLPDVLGITYAILRRGRELLYVVIGGALLAGEEAGLSGLTRRVRAQTEEGS